LHQFKKENIFYLIVIDLKYVGDSSIIVTVVVVEAGTIGVKIIE